MADFVLMPQMGVSEESALLAKWLVKEGDAIKKEQPLFSLETGKSSFEELSKHEGVLLKIFIPEGEDTNPDIVQCIYTHSSVLLLSCAQLFAMVWTVALQAPLSMGFFRQEYWSGLPFPPLGDLPNPEIEPSSPASSGGFFTTEPPGKPHIYPYTCL